MPKSSTQDRLENMLCIYPILESILGSSHRSSIVNLGQTCRGVRDILVTNVAPLCAPFPLCGRDLRPCAMCHTPVCVDCTRQTAELQHEVILLSFMGYTYTVVGGQRATHHAVWEAHQRARTKIVEWLPYIYDIHPKPDHFCQSCFPNHGPIMGRMVSAAKPDSVRRAVMDIKMDPSTGPAVQGLQWEYLPQPDSSCTCPEFNPVCEASVHLVRVERMFLRGEWRAFAWMPGSLRRARKPGSPRRKEERGEYPYFVDVW